MPGLRIWLKATTGAASQPSLAVTVAGGGTASHSTVASGGTPERVGAVVSRTVMTWVPVAAFKQSSVAVQVRVRVKLPLQLPEVGCSEKVMVGAESQLSRALHPGWRWPG